MLDREEKDSKNYLTGKYLKDTLRICLFWRKIYLIQTNIYLTQRYFVWNEEMLFNSDKSFVWIKKRLLNKLFFSIQSNLFECILLVTK